MRSASLLVVSVLVLALAVSSFSPVTAFQGIRIQKVTTNDDTTTVFPFLASGPAFYLRGGEYMLSAQIPAGDYEFTEEPALSGWVLVKVECEGVIMVPNPSTFTYIPRGVIIHYVAEDTVTCTFTNSPGSAVGGVVVSANIFALVAPWLAVIAVVGCIGTIVVIAKKRRS